MTARTPGFLKNTWFATGQIDTLSPARLQDFVDSGVPLFDAKNYGAVADGNSHALSTVTTFNGVSTVGYTLTQWRTVFGSFLTATTNEIDWAATQSAINAAVAAGGGTVILRAGSYRFINASSAGDLSGFLQFPNAGEYGTGAPAGPVVNMVGEFPQLSILNFPNDLGSGKGALVCTTDRFTNLSLGLFQDLQLIGPSAAAAMDGILWAGRRRMVRVFATQFHAGCNIMGDQTIHFDNNFSGNTYGLYYPDRTPGTYYNNSAWHRLILGGNTVAGIGVASAGFGIGETAFYDMTSVQQPYGIFKEGSGFAILDGVLFVNTQFEGITTALCGNNNAGAPTGSIANSRFIDTSFAWGGSKGRAILQLNTLSNTEFRGLRGVAGGQWQPGTVSCFEIITNINSIMSGDIPTLIANALSLSLPVFNSDFVPMRNTDGTQFGQAKGTISAAGTTQAGATLLAADFNDVTTAAAGSGVRLKPIFGRGMAVRVFNHGANAVLVYPATGGKINALATNAGFSLAAGQTICFVTFESTTQWYTVP